MQADLQVLGVPDLGKGFEKIAQGTGGRPARLVGLLGRDFLRHCKMIYDGDRAVVELIVDRNTLGQ